MKTLIIIHLQQKTNHSHMKKSIVLLGMLLTFVSFMSNASQEKVYLKYHRDTHSKNTTVLRLPQRLPIDVVYDDECRQIQVSGDEEMMAQVFLCDANGNTLDYSSTINVTFDVPEVCTETLIIRIEAEDWIAEGEVPLN